VRRGSLIPPTRPLHHELQTRLVGRRQRHIGGPDGCDPLAPTNRGRTPGESAAEGGIIVSFNPGWVRTDMGGDQAVLGAQESVTAMRSEFDKLTPADSGTFIDYDGRRIPW